MIGIKIVVLLAVAVQWMESAPLSPSTLKCSTLSDKSSSPDTLLFAVSTNPQGPVGEVNTNQAHFNLSEFKTRRKRYTHNPMGQRWAERHITYTVYSYPYSSEMSEEEVDSAIKLAFDVWAEYTPLSFTHVISGGDISIQFESSDHYRENSLQCIPFDDDGHLAHASFPNNDLNYIHFNYMKTWNWAMLFKVAVHEIGHSLGLDHSEDSVIMQRGPDDVDTPFSSYLNLSWDDLIGIFALYASDWI